MEHFTQDDHDDRIAYSAYDNEIETILESGRRIGDNGQFEALTAAYANADVYMPRDPASLRAALVRLAASMGLTLTLTDTTQEG